VSAPQPPAATGPPAAAPADWREYWGRDELWRDSPLWRVNAEVFLRRVVDVVPFGPGDVVLDVGCGPGHLEALLAPLVARVHAVDTAAQFVELCRERCRGFGNVTVEQLGENYTDVGRLGGPYTRILGVSVVQYYRGEGEIERLVASARTVAAPGALLLLADLPLERGPSGFAWDAACSLGRAARLGYLPTLLRAARGRWAGGSGYAAFARRAGELAFTPARLEALVARLGAGASVVRRGLSVYANRPSILVRL
jgi:SAM-dependent methyltransferase